MRTTHIGDITEPRRMLYVQNHKQGVNFSVMWVTEYRGWGDRDLSRSSTVASVTLVSTSLLLMLRLLHGDAVDVPRVSLDETPQHITLGVRRMATPLHWHHVTFPRWHLPKILHHIHEAL